MWDIKCLCSALFFFISNILFIVHGVIMMYGSESNTQTDNDQTKPSDWNFELWKDLDPDYIESRWIEREQSRPLMMCAVLFGAIAWFFLLVPVVQSAWVLSKGGKRLVATHMALAALGICGSIIELMARLIIVGMTNASQWLAKDFNLNDWSETDDGTGWRVLEMIHIIVRGMVLWIDTFEALAFFGIVVIMFYSVASEPKFITKKSSSIVIDADAASGGSVVSADNNVQESSRSPPSSPPASAFSAVTTKVPVEPTFSKCFTRFGLFVGVLAIVDFLADVLRFVDWKIFGRIAMATNTLLGVIFLPIWLLILGKELPQATERFEREAKRNSIIMNSLDDEKVPLKNMEIS